MLTREGCLQRQKRLRALMGEHTLDAVIVSDPRDIYYFTGVLLSHHIHAMPCCLWLEATGEAWAILPETSDKPTLEEVFFYESAVEGTVSPDLSLKMGALLEGRLGGKRVEKLGYQVNALSQIAARHVSQAAHIAAWQPVDALLAAMQAHKDPDEITVIRRCIEVNCAAYQAAAAAIRPGVSELDVLAAGQRGALLEAGEWIYHNGDYQCGTFNGPARARPIEDGELYIIDAWTCYRGYWSDMSYAYPVSGQMTPFQQGLFDHIQWVQEQVPGLLRAGTDGRDIWHALDTLIRKHPALQESGLVHHGGHSIGLRIHEMPDINRERGGLLEVGNVVAIEPGGYTQAARYGVRIENMYLITPQGAERLSPYPSLNLTIQAS